jgi:hypothetical protein
MQLRSWLAARSPEAKEHAMAQGQPEEPLSQERRKEIFLALVEAQDRELGVAESRKVIAAQFGVSEAQIRQIEREGLEGQWPPL